MRSLGSYCQTRLSNERTLRRCLKARVGMTKRGGACASLAERGRLRRLKRGDYLSFVAHQTRAGGRLAASPRRTRLPCRRSFFSRRRLNRPRPLLSTSSTIHGQHLADSVLVHLRLIARTPIFPRPHLLSLAKRGNASLRADAHTTFH